MIRIIILVITLPLLAWILNPFIGYILEFRGSFAYLMSSTGLVGWLGITAIFSAIALHMILFFYSFLK